MGKINLRTLASQLNLSASTVSKALMDSHEISTETKQRVHEMARELNYVPNSYASSLRRKKSKTIAVVLPEVADSFFSLAINGIESVAREKGYHVLIYLTHESFAREQSILKDFQGGRVDGILMSVSRETPNGDHIKEIAAQGIPVVFFDRVCEEMDTAKITTDDFESSYKATQHLLEQGCKQIAYLSISESLSISNKRMMGYREALTDHNIRQYPSDIVACNNDTEQHLLAIKKMMQQKRRPDGIVASVEKLATAVYIACKQLGILIPRQVKVISFSNLETAPILNPSLTTITQPAFDMGRAAATLLMKALNKSNFSLKQESLVIPSVITVRDSTAQD